MNSSVIQPYKRSSDLANRSPSPKGILKQSPHKIPFAREEQYGFSLHAMNQSSA